MKRLVFLSAIAMLILSSAGCRMCGKWWKRGADCMPSYEESTPIYGSTTVIPGPVTPLPGTIPAPN